jgi:hypothetical protein
MPLLTVVTEGIRNIIACLMSPHALLAPDEEGTAIAGSSRSTDKDNIKPGQAIPSVARRDEKQTGDSSRSRERDNIDQGQHEPSVLQDLESNGTHYTFGKKIGM